MNSFNNINESIDPAYRPKTEHSGVLLRRSVEGIYMLYNFLFENRHKNPRYDRKKSLAIAGALGLCRAGTSGVQNNIREVHTHAQSDARIRE